ncbi:unnamed protein product [Paramecium primaurelia]|uniref:Uncharacterized protein n=1 Tax=Paramecium primaurelia TaxID=5886 RepID=A0A8S1NXM1_PARPR|nr:unnamed protein product [Paramecium primaurelia]
MNKSSLGPKLLLQINIHIEDRDDFIPEEPFININKQQKSIQSKQRYDTKGRQIIKGKTYSIDFENCVIVCVYNPTEEVLQIKETLSQLSNVELTNANFKHPQSFNKQQQYTDLPIKSILKKTKQIDAVMKK